jgi:DNA-binding transcriptional LysR family regulator
VLLETSSTNPHLIAVEEGIAVGLIPTPRVDVGARIVQLHLEPPKTRRLYATYRRSYRLSESQRFLIDMIQEFYTLPINNALPPYRLDW